MKTILFLFLILLVAIPKLSAQNQRLAYSYFSSTFEKSIIEHLDKDKLTGKEEKLYDKFMKSLNRKCIVHFEKDLSDMLEAKGYQVLPLNAVEVMGNSALNLEGYPFIFFPKKTLKKHMDKDVADYFVSATLSITKPITAVVGLKPTATVTLKLFNQSGELLKKVSGTQKTEKKVSSIGFAVNQKESFSKIDMEHAEILYSKVQDIINAAIEDAVNQLGEEE